ncbi:MAG: ABC transporter substrate-binding protein [Rhodospirillales bacterium]|nr:ABC transporter substrate-binding protein [Rhodospirillales bacterium]
MFLQAAGTLLSLPSVVRAQSATTLKFIPYADLALLDPMAAAFVTRNHVLMVFDTLYALDEAGEAQPQMVEGHTVEEGGKRWLLTLRPGLTFHDGTPVLGRDVVASLQRWWTNDAYGQALAAATDEISAPSDTTVQFRLKRPFALLPQALAHPTNLVAAIMPERLARTPATTRLTEMVGSGPYRYLASERVAGARNVYARFEGYVPRPTGTPSFCAGPRIAHFDRVEWLTTPDPATQVAALRAGEVDWVEQPQMDLVPLVRQESGLRLTVAETKGLIGFLRFNFLFPPFDNPAIRRAVLAAVNQREFMEAVVGENAAWSKSGYFAPGSDMASDAGMAALSDAPDLAALKRQIEQAGYKGERVVYLSVNDVPRIAAIATVGADLLRKLGMNVDEVATDWGTVVQRSVSRQPLDKGGWSMFASFTGGYDMSTPGSANLLRGNGPRAYNGWPDMPKLEALRDRWLAADDLATRKGIARDIQMQAFQDVPFLPLGSYYQPTAYKADLTGMLKGLILFTNVKRG